MHSIHPPTLTAGLAADCPRCRQIVETNEPTSPDFDDRTPTTTDVAHAISNARHAADALRTATTLMIRDGGAEDAPSWSVYITALQNHAEAQDHLRALSTARHIALDANADDTRITATLTPHPGGMSGHGHITL